MKQPCKCIYVMLNILETRQMLLHRVSLLNIKHK